jgi:hypothetical protein
MDGGEGEITHYQPFSGALSSKFSGSSQLGAIALLFGIGVATLMGLMA